MLLSEKISLIHQRLLSRNVANDFFYTFSSKLAVNVFTFLRTVILVKLLTPEYYGQFSVIFSWALIISTIFDFGLGLGFLDKESKSSYEEKKISFVILIRARIILAIILFIFIMISTTINQGEKSYKLLIILTMGIGYSFSLFSLNFHQSVQDFKKYSAFDLKTNLFYLVWILIGLYILRVNLFSFKNFLWWTASASWLSFIFQFYGSNISLKEVFRINLLVDIKYLFKLIKFGKWIALSTISYIAFERYAVILLGQLNNSVSAGQYNLALYIGRATFVVAISLSTILHPRFSSIQNTLEIKKMLSKIYRIMLPLVILSLIIYYTIGHDIFLLIFGKDYVTSLIYIDILLPSFLLPLLTEPFVSITTFFLRKPQLIALLCSGKLIVFLVIGGGLFRLYEGLGLAWFQSISRFVEHLIVGAYVLYSFRKVELR